MDLQTTQATGQVKNKCWEVSISLEKEQQGLPGHLLCFMTCIVSTTSCNICHKNIWILRGSLASQIYLKLHPPRDFSNHLYTNLIEYLAVLFNPKYTVSFSGVSCRLAMHLHISCNWSISAGLSLLQKKERRRERQHQIYHSAILIIANIKELWESLIERVQPISGIFPRSS